MICQSSATSRPDRLADRKASPFSKQSLAQSFRVMAPALVELTFASAVHAQGTMDFSGATTLMTTFQTLAMYAEAVICFGSLIFAGIRMMSDRFQAVAFEQCWRKDWQDKEPHLLPAKYVAAWIQANLFLSLADAPCDREDPTLTPPPEFASLAPAAADITPHSLLTWFRTNASIQAATTARLRHC